MLSKWGIILNHPAILRCLLTSLAVLSLTSTALAADKPVIGPPPDWVKPHPVPAGTAVPDTAAVRVLLFDQQISFNKRGGYAVYMLPSLLRTFCLHFISSNMHYYGDVETNNPLQQTQVLNAWWLAPLHLFCFNFGSTHAIHHFVVKETFYVRQLTARRAHVVMREVGVRFNDFGTFRRSNRYARTEQRAAENSINAVMAAR